MKNTNPYKSFPDFVLRSPLFNFQFYKGITAGEVVSDEQFKEITKNDQVREAIYLASPSLYQEMHNWLNNTLANEKKIDKFKHAFLKYLARMSSRCTPFGLFAGCSLGQLDHQTNIALRAAKSHPRHTRLDMNYLVSLAQELVKIPNICYQLKFFPNSSIYPVGSQLRYVEYRYVNGNRKHHLASVDQSEYLEKILSIASEGGATLIDLAKSIVEEEISLEEAKEFLEVLVDNQLLISELEPSVSGPEFLVQIVEVLQKLNGTEDLLNSLNHLIQQLDLVDQQLGNDPEVYQKITVALKELYPNMDEKYLFQTDMGLNVERNTLDQTIVNSVLKGISLLNRISIPPAKTYHSEFKRAFRERYEARTVPAATALDIEMGLGYEQGAPTYRPTPLLDGLMLPSISSKSKDLEWNEVHSIFQKKIVAALKEGQYAIPLKTADFSQFEPDWNDLPDTMSFMVEVLMINGEQKIKFTGGGGSSAANLLGRFCHGDAALYNHVKAITEIEHEINADKILAEIVHLPEARAGNILSRPAFRKAEIPYLAKSNLDIQQQFSIRDLQIQFRQNRLLLRSERTGQEVIPRLTNAHNFSTNALPIYQFLADMQTANYRKGIKFSLGPVVNDFEFIPRIEFEDLILQPASWNLDKKAISSLVQTKDNDVQLKSLVSTFRSNRNMPQFVFLKDRDNELLINLSNLTSTRMLLDSVKNRSRFQLIECLYFDEGIVKDASGKHYCTNQIILSFYNQERLKKSKKATASKLSVTYGKE